MNLRRIPKSAVGAVGVSLAIISIVIGAFLACLIQDDIDDALSLMASKRVWLEILWQNHHAAEERARSAAMFQAMSMVTHDPAAANFALNQAATNLTDGIQTSMTAGGQKIPAEAAEEIRQLETKLRAGDSAAYTALQQMLDRARVKSAGSINELRTVLAYQEANVDRLRSKLATVHQFSLGFVLLGLMVTLLKDLSVWKSDEDSHALPPESDEPPEEQEDSPVEQYDSPAEQVTSKPS